MGKIIRCVEREPIQGQSGFFANWTGISPEDKAKLNAHASKRCKELREIDQALGAIAAQALANPMKYS